MRPKNTLDIMELKAKKIKRIQFVCNTILSNACYHTKEMETQLHRAERSGNITDDEKDVITKAWDLRNDLAKELMKDLETFISKERGGKSEKKKPRAKNQ